MAEKDKSLRAIRAAETSNPADPPNHRELDGGGGPFAFVKMDAPWGGANGGSWDGGLNSAAWDGGEITHAPLKLRSTSWNSGRTCIARNIVEEHKTSRLSMILAVLLVLAAALVVCFAPSGREAFSHWLGAGLLAVALGIFARKNIWAKGLGISFGAGDKQPEEPKAHGGPEKKRRR